MRKPKTEQQRRRAHRLDQLAKRQAVEASRPKARKDPAVEMFKNTSLEGAEGNPNSNPLWLNLTEFDERDRVRAQVDRWQNNTCVVHHDDFRVTLNNGRSYHASEFMDLQRRRAYRLLSTGADPRQVAKECFWTTEQVESLAQEFGFVRAV